MKVIVFILLFTRALLSCAQPAANYWEGFIEHNNKQWKVALEFVTVDNEQKARVDFIDAGGYRRLFTLAQNGASIRLERPQPNGTRIVFDGSIKGDVFTGTWSGIGIANARFILKPAEAPALRQEELRFVNKEATLSGTLLLPAKPGKHPVVVLMHGGAPEERMVNWDAALTFVRQGIGGLIYDKRGVGKSTGGNWQTDGLTALAGDAVAAVELLKTRPDIDANNIAVYGHSEGGWTAPLAASKSEAISFVIVSGASSVNAAEQTNLNRQNVMRQAGFDTATVQRGSRLWKQAHELAKLCTTDRAAALRGKKILEDSIEAVHTKPWFPASGLPYPYPSDCPTDGVLELLFADPLQVWAKIKAPVLAVWGERDIVVPVARGVREIQKTLADAGNRDVSTVVMPNVNHSAFCENPDETEWDFPRQAPGYFEQMAEWMSKRLKK